MLLLLPCPSEQGLEVSCGRLPPQVGDERWTSVFNPQTRRFEEQLKMHYRQVAFDVVRPGVSVRQLKDRSSVSRTSGTGTQNQRELVCLCMELLTIGSIGSIAAKMIQHIFDA